MACTCPDNCLQMTTASAARPLLYLCSLVQHCDNFHQTRAHRPTAGHCCTVNGNFMFLFSAQKASFSIHVIAKYRPMMGKIWEHRPLLVTAPWTSHWVTAVIPCKPGQSQRGESYTLSFHGIQSARLVIYESFIQKRSTHKKYLRYQSILFCLDKKDIISGNLIRAQILFGPCILFFCQLLLLGMRKDTGDRGYC